MAPTTTTAAPTTTTAVPPPAATPTTSTTAPPAPLEKVAPRGALHKGDKVGIVTRPIRVTGADLRACEERLDRNAPTTTSTVGPCAAEAAGITNARQGTLLVSFDEGVFTLGRDGVVANNGVIARACGNSPCERFDPPSQLGLSVALFAGLAVVAGMSNTVRQPPRSNAWLKVNRLLAASFL